MMGFYKRIIKDLAKAGYEGYCSKTDNKSLATGAQLPSWENLPEVMQEAWIQAADSMITLMAQESQDNIRKEITQWN